MSSCNRRYFFFNSSIFLSILIIFCLVISCTKVNVSIPSVYKEDLTDVFLKLPSNSPSVIRKIAAKIALQNSEQKFLNRIAHEDGIPLWVINPIKKRNSAERNSLLDDANVIMYVQNEDTIVIVPLIQPQQYNVHSFLNCKIRGDSVYISLFRGNMYSAYDNSTDLHSLTSNFIAYYIMHLDHLIFGYKYFLIRDHALFNYPSIESNAYEFRYITLGSPQSQNSRLPIFDGEGVVDCEPVNISMFNGNLIGISPDQEYFWDQIDFVCVDYNFWNQIGMTGDGGTGTTTGTTGTSGGSGNGQWWDNNPCIDHSIDGVGLPCGASELGWVPVDDELENKSPCDKANNLVSIPNFLERFRELQALTSADYEAAYVHEEDDDFYYFQGPSGGKQVLASPQSNLKGYFHSHSNGAIPMFSPDDFKTVWDFERWIDIRTFYFGVTTQQGTYILVVDNLSQFRRFLFDYFDDGGRKNIDGLAKDYGAYNIVNSNSAELNEKRFLEFIKREDMGLKLLKADPGITRFDLLELNRDGELVKIPCS
jgi:hypothetical protein